MSKALLLEGVGKAYVLGTAAHKATSVVDRLAQSRQRNSDKDHTVLWAVKDLSFSVEIGETVGLIGHNGAGKSTTLKLISRITPPTEGRISIRGTVGSLLEVGTGFHPELTGRENIFFNGALLGLSRRRVTELFDSIVDFAEIESFLDTPVKRYSSGMYMRLAFAVAAHLAPDVLIIDEVLAVGDAAFQRKCLAKIRSIAASGDRAVLFVSHNLESVANLCTRVQVLDHGRSVYDGEVREGIARYLDLFARTSDSETPGVYRQFPNREATDPVIVGLRVLNGQGEPTDTISALDPVALEIELDRDKDVSGLLIASAFLSETGQVLTYTTSRGVESASGLLTCRIPRFTLRPGRYHIGFTVRSVGATGYLEYCERSAHLTVLPTDAATQEEDENGVLTLDEVWTAHQPRA